MRTLSILFALVLFIYSAAFTDSLPLTPFNWEGNSWVGNNNIGYWWPAIDTAAQFAINDISWGQIRTIDPISTGTKVTIDVRPILTSGGTNNDIALFGFTDGWVNYAGQAFGVAFYDGVVRIFESNGMNSNYHFADTIGTYIPGDRIKLSVTLKSDGGLHVAGPGISGDYMPTVFLSDYRFVAAIKDAELGQGFQLFSVEKYAASLIAQYNFTGNADDSSGNGYHGVATDLSDANDRFGQSIHAYSFEGTSSRVTLPYGAIGMRNTTERAFSVWVHPTTIAQEPNNGGIIAQYEHGNTSTSNYFVAIDKIGSSVRINVAGDGNGRLDGALTDDPTDKWIHVVVNMKSGTNNTSIYINGRLLISGTVNYNSVLSTLSPIIGDIEGGGNDDRFRGDIDDIRVYGNNLTIPEIRALYQEGRYRHYIISAQDVPGDQGGWIRITLAGMYLDKNGATPQVRSYGIWRKIPFGVTPMSKAPINLILANDTLGQKYDYLGTVMAVQASEYNTIVPSLSDSSASGLNAETYIVTAHTDDPNEYYISLPGSGYSVDNLAPNPPASIATNITNGRIEISWPTGIDDDIATHRVYRSTTPDFIPSPGNLIDTTSGTSIIDSTIVAGYLYYYKITAQDYHGNSSVASGEIQAGAPTLFPVSLHDNWNLVSVGPKVGDYGAISLFSGAASSIFEYQGGYHAISTLSNGPGYWVKFASPATYDIQGYFNIYMEIPVVEGWNIIGSCSEPVMVDSLYSSPPGLVVSRFWSYAGGGYTASAVIEPSKGYWVKASQAGTIILSVDGGNASNRVRIVPSEEMPPAPPESEGMMSSIPDKYKVYKNYPDPFNPSTTVRYDIPILSRTTLAVYNVIGQEVGILFNGVREAGTFQAEFNATDLPSGVYFLKFDASSLSGESISITAFQKMLLVK